MAAVTTYQVASNLTPDLDVGMFNLALAPSIANAAANNGDYIVLATIGRAARILHTKQNVKASLGAGCVVQTALYRAGALVQNLAAASTAAAASITTGVALGNPTCQAGDQIVLVVSGANVGAAAGVEVDVQLQH
jgi:hypothetical protein